MASVTINRDEHIRLLEAEDALHRLIKDVIEPFQDSMNRDLSEPAQPERGILEDHPLVIIGQGMYEKRIMAKDICPLT